MYSPSFSYNEAPGLHAPLSSPSSNSNMLQGQQAPLNVAGSFPIINRTRLNSALPAILEETGRSEDWRQIHHLEPSPDTHCVASNDPVNVGFVHYTVVPASAPGGIDSQLVAQRAIIAGLDVEDLLIAAIDKRLNELFILQQRLQAASAAAAASTSAPGQHTTFYFPNNTPTAPVVSRIINLP